MSLTIDQTHMMGSKLRLVGEAVLEAGISGVMLHHPRLAAPTHVLVDGRGATGPAGVRTVPFDVTLPVDLLADGMEQLGFLRMRSDGGVETEPYSIAQVVFPDMQPGGFNHAHMIGRLGQLARPRPAVRDMLARFESLGESRTFGLFAEAFAARPPALLDHGDTGEWMAQPRRSIHDLCFGLAARFEGLGADGDLAFEQRDGEWLSRSRRYRLVFHTGLTDPTMTPDELAAYEGRRLHFARRKFLLDLDDPRKIFVRQSAGMETEADMRQLRAAMTQGGKAWLLWVEAESPHEPAVTVTLVGDRLLKVSHAALHPPAAGVDPDLQGWSDAIEGAFLVAGLVAPGWEPDSFMQRVGSRQLMAR